ncbi:MAG: hypothetical protein ABW061_21475 [Polyangiaceae bacterium]
MDAHHAHALAFGAQIAREPRTDDFGAEHWADRSDALLDPEGNLCWLLQGIRG